MTTPFLGEIQIFGFNYTPEGWAPCNGTTLPIQQYSALYSLIGTTYGGNGTTTFQLPNFTGRAACSQGQGPGLTDRSAGETFGEAQVGLISSEIPSHNHVQNLYHQPNPAMQKNVPDNNYGLSGPAATSPFVPIATPNTTFALPVVGVAGSGLPHNNCQPLLPLNFCIALQGDFPAFN